MLEEREHKKEKFSLDSISWVKFNLEKYLPNQQTIVNTIALHLENTVSKEISELGSSQFSDSKGQYIFRALNALNNLFAFEKAIELDNDKLAFDLWYRKDFPLETETLNTLLTKNTRYYKIIISTIILRNELQYGTLDKNLIRNITEELVNVITNEKINHSPLRRLEIYFGLYLPPLEDDWAAQLSFFCFDNEFYDLYAIVIKAFSNMDLIWDYDANVDIEDSFSRLVYKGNWELFFELKQRHQVKCDMDRYLLLAAEKKQWHVVEKILSMHPKEDLDFLGGVNDEKVVPFGFTALSFVLAEETTKTTYDTAMMLIFLGAKHALYLKTKNKALDLYTLKQYVPFLLDDPEIETTERLMIYKLSQIRFEQLSADLNRDINDILEKIYVYNKHNLLPKEIEKKILVNQLKLALPALILLPDEIVAEKGLSFTDFLNLREKEINEFATHTFNLFAKANEHLFWQYKEEKREFLTSRVKYYIKKYSLIYNSHQSKVFLHIFGKKVPKAETEGLKSKTILKNRFRIALRAAEIALDTA